MGRKGGRKGPEPAIIKMKSTCSLHRIALLFAFGVAGKEEAQLESYEDSCSVLGPVGYDPA